MFNSRKEKSSLYALGMLTLVTAITGCGRPGEIIGGQDDWVIEQPETYGMSSDALNQSAFQVGNLPGRQCLVVIKNGTLIHETYYTGDAGTRNYGYSASKSFGATVVGVAVTHGYLSLDDKVSDYTSELPESMNPDATIRHLLGQVAQAAPLGSTFKYDTFGTVLTVLNDVLMAATGEYPVQFAYDNLLEPIGIKNSSWGASLEDNLPIGAGGNWTCRDMARLGQLYLNKGMWKGSEIISEQFVNEATSPSYPDANSAYGYLWWLNKEEGNWYRPVTSGQGLMMPNAPNSLYFATGLFGQLIIVDEDEDLVIATMGNTVEVETLNTVKQVWQRMEGAL